MRECVFNDNIMCLDGVTGYFGLKLAHSKALQRDFGQIDIEIHAFNVLSAFCGGNITKHKTWSSSFNNRSSWETNQYVAAYLFKVAVDKREGHVYF